MSTPFGVYMTAAKQSLGGFYSSKEDLFTDIYEKPFLGRTLQYLDPVTNNHINQYTIKGFGKDKEGNRAILLLSDSGEKITLSEKITPYEKNYSYNVCSDAGCNIMGGVSRKKRKTRGRRRKTKNNRKRKTYRKRK